MPKNSVPEWDTTAANNTDVGGNSTAEGQLPGSLNDAIRELMSQLKEAIANQGSDIASASSIDLGAATGNYVRVTGTTTITALGTVAAGTTRWVEFTGILTLTYNATSLKLPGSANITTAAGDVACFISLGSGNWRCVSYLSVSGAPITLDRTTTAAGAIATWTSTDAGAAAGPSLNLYRNSSTPAANDITGSITFTGKDSGGNDTVYAKINSFISDPTNGSEDGGVLFTTLNAGADANWVWASGELYYSSLLSAKGIPGALNAQEVYVGGHGTVAQRVTDTETANTVLGTILPYDDTIPQNTEGDEILSVAITPVKSTSTLFIEAVVNIGAPSGTAGSIALFVDSTADALAAASTVAATANDMSTVTLRYSVSAGSTSARTYKIRAGASGATDARLNGHSTARIFGGVAVSSLTVTEVLPQ